ncbi:MULTISPECIES: HAD family hydrolase [Streptomyces]|uniref:HAD family hydrolase n=2 Tax=Streptomyces TaxID=1883 RepID=A0AB39NNS1_9ACTN|nr:MULTISPECIES: HAD family hydrolase [Streptomyces]MCI4142104.1 HAD family hydrolase [Streptomyces sp. MMS20-AI2-20]GGQ34651.1 hydrolase [Streptomyces gancidicus]GGS53199.1 hydrolase [Streptomyces rubiginosus]
MRYDLVIFDNDGVLVDSEPLSNRHLAAYLTELGHPTTYEDSIRDYMGSAMHRVHDLIEERTGKRLPTDFDDVFHARVFAAFERELRPVPGVADVLEKLAADGVPYCVASSGSHERIRVGHRAAGLNRFFDDGRIFSSQDVGRGKPAPDLFLYAAERMGTTPERCVVVEDSPLGVQAAVAAGMDVYGFTAMTPAEKLSGATRLFGDMRELSSLLGLVAVGDRGEN